MTPASFSEQMENEKLWREEEIRAVNNLISLSSLDKDKNLLRRAGICLLYSHVEGFVKFSFKLYIDGVNMMELLCKDVKPVLAAAVYHHDFLRLTNPDAKSKIFKKDMPDDAHIHRIYRHEEFFEKIESFFESKIKIEDGYINTESNVGREVLERLLYQVGLQHKSLNTVIGSLTRLKNKRNDIAHGADKSIIDAVDYTIFHNCALGIMKELSKVLYNAFECKDYLKKIVEI